MKFKNSENETNTYRTNEKNPQQLDWTRPDQINQMRQTKPY